MNFIAEASKPKLYHWAGLTDASEDWIAYHIKLDALLTAAGCKPVSNRLTQLPLLIPIPEEPQPPAPIAAAAPTPHQFTTFGYEVANYKLHRDVYDRIVKVHKDAEENAEKAFNKWPELHTTSSKFLTGVLRIQAERRQAAWQIVADLAAFGFTYLTAQALIVQNDVADAAIIALLTPIVAQYPAVINGATNVSILYAAQDWIERESSLRARLNSERCIKSNSASLGIMTFPRAPASASVSSLLLLVGWRNQGVHCPSKPLRKLWRESSLVRSMSTGSRRWGWKPCV